MDTTVSVIAPGLRQNVARGPAHRTTSQPSSETDGVPTSDDPNGPSKPALTGPYHSRGHILFGQHQQQ